jgi:hypothetical protein
LQVMLLLTASVGGKRRWSRVGSTSLFWFDPRAASGHTRHCFRAHKPYWTLFRLADGNPCNLRLFWG